MEGYLQKWIGIVYGWKSRYFILHYDVLIYCNNKGEQKKGSVSLKVASFSETPEDPLRIIADTGVNEMHLRAKTVEEKLRWLNALKKAQQEVNVNEEKLTYKYTEDERHLSPASKQLFKDSKINALHDSIAELWTSQAEFDEAMSMLIPKIEKNNEAMEIAEKMIELGNQLKVVTTLFLCKISIKLEENGILYSRP